MSTSNRTRFALAATVSAAAMLSAAAAHAQEVAVTPEEAESPTRPGGVSGPQSGIAEIVVTAQRRAESLQDVPVAVSAFSDEGLAEQQITDTLALQQALPNTTFTKGNFTGSNITIRGIGSAAVATSGDSGVAVHFNDMPLVSGGLFETEFYDLERLEVLRGPQGTLFGRNATGGVVNFITAKPSFDFEAAGEFEYGNYESITGKAMVNVPLGDIAAVRVSGIYLNRDGFTDNLRSGNDIDGRDYYSFRGSLMVEPTDRTTLTVTGQYREEDSNRARVPKQLCATDPTGVLGCRPDQLGFGTINGNATLATILTSQEFFNIVAPGLAPFAAGSLYEGLGGFGEGFNPANLREVFIDFEPIYMSDQLIVQGELDHEFENFSVTLNGGYVDGSIDTFTDYNLATTDSLSPLIQRLNFFASGAAGEIAQAAAGAVLGTPLFQDGQICVSEANRNYVGFIGGEIRRCADNSTEFDRSRGSSEQWSIEGRVATDFDGPFNFLLGGLYLDFNSEGDYFVNASLLDYAGLLLGGPGSGNAVGPPMFNSETNLYELKSYGVFGEVYFDVTDDLKITGGLRYSNDEKFVRDRQFLLDFPIPYGAENIDGVLQTLVDNNVRGPDGSFVYDADPAVEGAQAFREITREFDEITGRFVIDWNPITTFTDDTLLYVSYSRGYKPGGINPPFDPSQFEAPVVFDAEIINAVEVGTKNVIGGGTALINLVGFYYDYKGLQVSRIVNRTSFNDNTDAQVFGVELETVLNPVEGLTINATVSYQETEIKDLQLVDTRDPSGGRSDAVIIKDITNRIQLRVHFRNARIRSIRRRSARSSAASTRRSDCKAPVPVPGTSALGAFSICECACADCNRRRRLRTGKRSHRR